MVIPGSHKSNLLHPVFAEGAESVDEVPAAVELPLKADDDAFSVDCMAHGSARRTNPGQRRVLIIRYGPHWGNDRYGFQPSPELIMRLTPTRRKIVQPLPPKVLPDHYSPAARSTTRCYSCKTRRPHRYATSPTRSPTFFTKI